MYSKTAKAAMHEIPWNAKPTYSSADKIDYFFLTAAFFIFAAGFFVLAASPGIWIIGNGTERHARKIRESG